MDVFVTIVGLWYWKTGLNSVQNQHLCGMCHAWGDKVEKQKALVSLLLYVCIYSNMGQNLGHNIHLLYCIIVCHASGDRRTKIHLPLYRCSNKRVDLRNIHLQIFCFIVWKQMFCLEILVFMFLFQNLSLVAK